MIDFVAGFDSVYDADVVVAMAASVIVLVTVIVFVAVVAEIEGDSLFWCLHDYFALFFLCSLYGSWQ